MNVSVAPKKDSPNPAVEVMTSMECEDQKLRRLFLRLTCGIIFSIFSFMFAFSPSLNSLLGLNDERRRQAMVINTFCIFCGFGVFAIAQSCFGLVSIYYFCKE